MVNFEGPPQGATTSSEGRRWLEAAAFSLEERLRRSEASSGLSCPAHSAGARCSDSATARLWPTKPAADAAAAETTDDAATTEASSESDKTEA